MKVPATLRRLGDLVTFLILFLAAWVPRQLALGTFVTPDERKWLNRSAEFYRALQVGDLASTFQKEHPGVTVLWSGALGFLQRFPGYARQAPGPMTDEQLDRWLYQATTHTPLELLVAGRWWIVLFAALALALCFFPLRRSFGGWLAAAMVLVVAWAPFHVALSRQLHPDGTLAAFTLLALVSFLAWLYGSRQWRYLVWSGVAMGLALLTKTPAGIAMVVAGLLTLWEWWRLWRTGAPGKAKLVGSFAAWCLLATAVFFALWPALWLDPVTIFVKMFRQLGHYAVEGHDLPNYFLGQVVHDVGPFFYPVAWLFRTTPAALIGLGLAVVWLVRRAWPLDNRAARNSFVALLLYAGFFALTITTASKKFDRYLLPAFPPLDVLAVLGLAGAVAAVWSRWSRRRGGPAPVVDGKLAAGPGAVVIALLLLLHGWPGFQRAPYYLTYYNPLVGGGAVAPRVLLIGWGEGLDQAAAWLNARPGGDRLRIVGWYGDGPLSYYLDTREPVQSFEWPSFWFDADYAVLYVNQWQRRNPDPELIDHFLRQTPAAAFTLGGLDYVHVYDLRGQPPAGFTDLHVDRPAVFGDAIRLAARRLAQPAALPGDTVRISLFLQSLAPMAEDYHVRLRLVDPAGRTVWADERWPSGRPTSEWPVGEVREDRYRVEIPGDAAPGDYALQYSVFDPETGGALPVQADPGEGGDHADEWEVVRLVVTAPEWAPNAATWPVVQVTELRHAATLQPGQMLPVELRAAGQTDGELKLSLRLVDPAGVTQAQVDKVLEPELRYALELPPEAPPGTYRLEAVVYDPETLQGISDVEGRPQTQLSAVEVRSD